MEGTRLGPYQILAELGSGGMGRVYRAELTRDAAGLKRGAAVAVKVLHAHLLEREGFLKRFLREAQIGQTVEHENVVRCFDCDATLVNGQQQNFLVMEYVEGQTLRELLTELERVPEELCRHIGREVAKGLAAIHEAGVLHRDLKPENVLITPEHVVKVMDLGVARLEDEAVRLSQTGVFVGSVEYAAPEQFRSADGEPDGRADLHALGVLLYELGTGQHPYRDEDFSRVLRNILHETPRKAGELHPQLSPFYEEVVATLMAKDRRERFPSASRLSLALEQGEEGAWWTQRARALRDGTRRPLRRIRIPRDTALYGRQEDLARLQVLYEQARAGHGQVLLLEGEAGIGKTRLVDEFVGRLREQGEDLNLLFGSYPPGGAATAAGAFSTAYREHFGAEGLERTLAGVLPETPLLVPAFAALLSGGGAPPGVPSLTKDSLQTVFVHATRALAAERTTIVMIDDLHFAPAEGRALFTSLAVACPGHRVLLVGTMRPGLPRDWVADLERLEHAHRATLPRLGPKDLFQLLEDSFRSERLARELGMQISLKCDGNPFFAFEIVRGLREGQFISQQPDGTWVTTRIIQDIRVPSSVLDLVGARVADLDDQERNLLDVAACHGFEFDPSLVGSVLGLPRIPALQAFGRIEKRHRLVRSVGRRYVFDHHQVQEALHGSLNDQLREEYHAALGEGLEAGAGPSPDGTQCVELCRHFLCGARGAQALPYVEPALDHLERSHLLDPAIDLAGQVLGAAGLLEGRLRLELLLRHAEHLHRLGRREAEEAVLQEARALAQEEGMGALRGRAELALGRLCFQTGRGKEALPHMQRALEIARRLGSPADEAGAHIALGHLRRVQGRLEDARVEFEQGLALQRKAGSAVGEANACMSLGPVYAWLERHEDALAHATAALQIAHTLESPQLEAGANLNLGVVWRARGDVDRSVAHQERALELCHQIGDRTTETAATVNLANSLLTRRRLEEARVRFEQGLVLCREIGHREFEANALLGLGGVLLGLGRFAEALEQYRRQLEIVREIGDQVGELYALSAIGRSNLALGRREQAQEHGARCLALAREVGERDREAVALCELAAVAHERGDEDAAAGLLGHGLDLLRELGQEHDLADAVVLLGTIRREAGDEAGARVALREALDLLRNQGRRAEVPSSLALLVCLGEVPAEEAEAALAEAAEGGESPTVYFVLWQATGKHEHLAEAKRLLDYRVEHVPEEYRESMLKNVRLNREIMGAWAEHREG